MWVLVGRQDTRERCAPLSHTAQDSAAGKSKAIDFPGEFLAFSPPAWPEDFMRAVFALAFWYFSSGKLLSADRLSRVSPVALPMARLAIRHGSNPTLIPGFALQQVRNLSNRKRLWGLGQSFAIFYKLTLQLGDGVFLP